MREVGWLAKWCEKIASMARCALTSENALIPGLAQYLVQLLQKVSAGSTKPPHTESTRTLVHCAHILRRFHPRSRRCRHDAGTRSRRCRHDAGTRMLHLETFAFTVRRRCPSSTASNTVCAVARALLREKMNRRSEIWSGAGIRALHLGMKTDR
jgi:hypothetical protein